MLHQDSWLVPLEQLPLGSTDPTHLYQDYRALLYYRGAVPSGPHHHVIPAQILAAEQTRGFHRPGAYRKQLGFFTRSLVLGTQLQVEDWIRDLRRKGYYLRRRYAIPQKVDRTLMFSLREQRTLPQRT